MRRQLHDAQSKKGPYVINAGNEGPDQTAHAQFDLGLRCLLTESMNIVERIDEQKMPCSDCTNAQADLSIAVRLWHEVYFVLCYKA